MNRNWPTSLTEKANEFTFARRDPDEIPEIKVTTWSSLFGEGGSVSVDAVSEGHRDRMAAISIDKSRSVAQERAWLQRLVDEWNENAEENWRTFILKCRESVTAYHRRQVIEDRPHRHPWQACTLHRATPQRSRLAHRTRGGCRQPDRDQRPREGSEGGRRTRHNHARPLNRIPGSTGAEVRERGHLMTADPFDLIVVNLPDETQLDWQARAACATTDPDLFFPEKGGDHGVAAKKVCGGCEVKQQCLAWQPTRSRSTTAIWRHGSCLMWKVEPVTFRRSSRSN